MSYPGCVARLRVLIGIQAGRESPGAGMFAARPRLDNEWVVHILIGVQSVNRDVVVTRLS